MTTDRYKALTETERLIYDEFSGFAVRVTSRMEEIIALLQKIMAEAGED